MQAYYSLQPSSGRRKEKEEDRKERRKESRAKAKAINKEYMETFRVQRAKRLAGERAIARAVSKAKAKLEAAAKREAARKAKEAEKARRAAAKAARRAREKTRVAKLKAMGVEVLPKPKSPPRLLMRTRVRRAASEVVFELPVLVRPKRGECINGLLARAAIENSVPSAAAIARLANVKAPKTSYDPVDCVRLGKLLGLTYEDIISIGPVLTTLHYISFTDFDCASSNEICKTRRRLCPLCIAEDPYHRSDWNLKFVRACYRHNVRLIDQCPDCGWKLTWRSAALAACPVCGCALSEAPAMPIAPSQLFASKLLRWTKGKFYGAPDRPPAFERLEPQQTWRALLSASDIQARLNAGIGASPTWTWANLDEGVGDEVEKWLTRGLDMLSQPFEGLRSALEAAKAVVPPSTLASLARSYSGHIGWPIADVIMEKLLPDGGDQIRIWHENRLKYCNRTRKPTGTAMTGLWNSNVSYDRNSEFHHRSRGI